MAHNRFNKCSLNEYFSYISRIKNVNYFKNHYIYTSLFFGRILLENIILLSLKLCKYTFKGRFSTFENSHWIGKWIKLSRSDLVEHSLLCYSRWKVTRKDHGFFEGGQIWIWICHFQDRWSWNFLMFPFQFLHLWKGDNTVYFMNK